MGSIDVNVRVFLTEELQLTAAVFTCSWYPLLTCLLYLLQCELRRLNNGSKMSIFQSLETVSKIHT